MTSMFPTEREIAYSYALVTLWRRLLLLGLFPHKAADSLVCLYMQANWEEIKQFWWALLFF